MLLTGHLRHVSGWPSLCRCLTTVSSEQASSSSYCVDLVKRRDYEGFLCTLLLPHVARRAAFAVRAFNVEVASVRESVSERTLGRMRMQFWADAIEAIFNGDTNVPAHPVALELHRAVENHKLSKELLLRVLESRRALLSDRPFDSLDEVDKFSHDSCSSINYLLLESLRSDSEPLSGHTRHAANQLGLSQGLVTLLRAVLYNASQRRVMLPSNLMMEHDISVESVVRMVGRRQKGESEQETREKLKLVVEATAARAQDHLDNCRFRSKYLSKEHKLVLLPAVAVDGFLRNLHLAGCDVLDPRLQQRNSWLPLSLYYHRWKGSY